MDYTNENLGEAAKTKLSSIEEQFINMRATGQTVRQIARKLKKSNKTICDLNKKYFREVSDLRNEKLEVLQRKIFEQKQSRLDFLTEQLLIVKEAISEKKIYLNYDQLVTLAIKISGALNKCERDMFISDLISETESVENPPRSEIRRGERKTNVSGEKNDNNIENKEVKAETKNSGNAETQNKKTNKEEIKKSGNEKQNGIDAPPTSRADIYKRILRDKLKSQKPPE